MNIKLTINLYLEECIWDPDIILKSMSLHSEKHLFLEKKILTLSKSEKKISFHLCISTSGRIRGTTPLELNYGRQ